MSNEKNKVTTRPRGQLVNTLQQQLLVGTGNISRTISYAIQLVVTHTSFKELDSTIQEEIVGELLEAKEHYVTLDKHHSQLEQLVSTREEAYHA